MIFCKVYLPGFIELFREGWVVMFVTTNLYIIMIFQCIIDYLIIHFVSWMQLISIIDSINGGKLFKEIIKRDKVIKETVFC